MANAYSPVNVACLQMDIKLHALEENRKTAERLIRAACDQGAELMVLPETFTVGEDHENRKQVYAYAEPVPGGPTTQMLAALAVEKGVYITGSIIENEEGRLYNTAVLCGPKGYIGRFRKLHLCENENFWFEPGDLGVPVFKTEIGNIAMMICLDGYYPEVARIAALQGADIICVPTNWSDMSARGRMEGFRTLGPALTMSAALSNHIFVAACNRVGQGGFIYPGQSLIAAPQGMPVGGPAGDEEEIVLAAVDLMATRQRYFTATNSRLRNRRTDVYDALLGYDPGRWPVK